MVVKEFILLNIVLPFAEKIQGTCATKWYKRIKQMSTWSSEEIKGWQERELHRFIKHAYEHTIYYKLVFDELKIKPEDIHTAEDLKKLPIITKDIVREHHDEFIPDNLSSFKYRRSRTGGTTGVPMEYFCDENTWGYVTAAKIYYWKKSGYKYGDAFIALGSSSLFSKKPSWKRCIYDKIRNEHPLNCVDMTDSKCVEYVKYIQRYNIHHIYGYAAAIYIFTKYISEHNINLTQIKTVFTTSENLPDHYRQLIEKTYQCEVIDCYGAKDAGITGYETSYHHYCVGYNSIVEVIDEVTPNSGTAISTNFLNYSFPLIRYQFGDELQLADNSHIYNGQVITSVNGRTSEVLKLANGRSLSATGFSMIMKEFDIKAFRILQNSPNEITIQILPIIEKYTKDQEYSILTEIKHHIGGDSKIYIKYVDKFDTYTNGKQICQYM